MPLSGLLIKRSVSMCPMHSEKVKALNPRSGTIFRSIVVEVVMRCALTQMISGGLLKMIDAVPSKRENTLVMRPTMRNLRIETGTKKLMHSVCSCKTHRIQRWKGDVYSEKGAKHQVTLSN
jgi:hypothetical protein